MKNNIFKINECHRLIWQNTDLDLDDWRDALNEEYPGLSEDELIQKMYELNDLCLDDERSNLDIQLDRPILILADLGLWNGRRIGYKEINSGNIKDCLYADLDTAKWYIDKNGDLCFEGRHHDGTNYYQYRVYKNNVSDTQIENLKYKIYSGQATRADITRVTNRLGDYIADVYGFDIPRKKI